jgi:hypothetical protein
MWRLRRSHWRRRRGRSRPARRDRYHRPPVVPQRRRGARDFADGDDREEIVLRDASAGLYRRLVLKDNRIIGTVLFGDTLDGAWRAAILARRICTCSRHAPAGTGLSSGA